MDWTMLLLHAFWDSWLHERDVLLAQGWQHPTDGDATAYATAYGVFIAAAVASMFGDHVQEELTLGGDGGGVFDLDAHRTITLTVTRVTTAGPPARPVKLRFSIQRPIERSDTATRGYSRNQRPGGDLHKRWSGKV